MTLLQEPCSTGTAILIVDDEPLARMEMGEVVRRCGFQAWEAAKTRSGIVLANHVHFMWPHIAIVVISAARRPMDGELPEHVSFLPKPIPPTALVSALQSSH
jgi:CheY-like chemotaxis protein